MHATHVRAFASDRAFPEVLATVVDQWRNARVFADVAAVERSEFRAPRRRPR
jgi:hypothetical protein